MKKYSPGTFTLHKKVNMKMKTSTIFSDISAFSAFVREERPLVSESQHLHKYIVIAALILYTLL